MPNTLDNILSKIVTRGVLALREQAVMPRLVNMDFGREAAQAGQVIDVPLPKPQPASDVTPAPTYASAQSNTPGRVWISLNRWKHSSFYLTDKEMAEVDASETFIPMQASEALRALANEVDTDIYKKYVGVYGYVGTAGTTPMASGVGDVVTARKVLNNQLAPMDSRRAIWNPDAEANALQVAQFSDLEKTRDRGVKIEGELGRKFGFDHFMSQNIQTHTAGTLAAIGVVVASTTAAGATAIDLKSNGATGSLVLGDVFTIAGQTQTYVVKTAVPSLTSATPAAVEIDPPLKANATINAVGTLKASHVVNLAFQRNAFAFANRPLAGDIGLGTRVLPVTDRDTGISLRLEVSRQYKQVMWDFDILWCTALVRPELATRIPG